MANSLPGDISHQGINVKRPSKYHDENLEDDDQWYFSKKEIEENSPSRADGIDLKKETYLRKSYCTFLQDLGMRLRVPQITIATAIICCHRFYLCQSHARNDRRVIATVCMFLAGKVEESPRPLKDVIYVAYEIIHKKDPEAFQRIKQKEVYEQQKELILDGERLVLTTLGFGLNVHHPYKPLVEAIKKFKVAQNTLAQVAWNFVNDGLRTSLCLQFKPHHIAAGAIFLAAKFLKVKLPSDGEKVWWQEFDVNPRQLEEVSNQMLELYEQNRVPPTASETEGSTVGSNQRPLAKSSSANEEHASKNGYIQAAATSVKPSCHNLPPTDNRSAPLRTSQDHSENHGSAEKRSALVNDGEFKGVRNEVEKLPSQENARDDQSTMKLATDRLGKDQERNGFGNEMREPAEAKDKHTPPDSEYRESTVGPSPQEAIKKIDIHKVKAALGKRRKAKGDVARKTDFLDEDDLIERELENGIELASDNDKSQGRRQSSSKPMDRQEEPGETHHGGIMGQSAHKLDQSNMEEGEVPLSDSRDYGFHSPKSSNRKRKGRSSPEKSTEGRQRNDHLPSSNHYNHYDQDSDRNRTSRQDYMEKRHKLENHV